MTAKTTPKSDVTASAAAASQQGYALPEGFVEVGADRFMYNPNKDCTGALQGYLLGLVDMPALERGKDRDGNKIMQQWQCLLVRTTAACKGIDREQKVVDVKPGSDVLTPATFRLNDTFARAAVDPENCHEVFIAPKKKIDIGHGQTMWLYAMGANPKSVKSRKSFGIAAILPGSTEIKSLPQGSATAEGAGSGSDVATPF